MTTDTAPAPAMTFDAPGQPLAAGRYQSDELAVPIALTLDGGWVAGPGEELEEVLDIYSASPEGASLWFLTLPNVIDPSDPAGMREIDAPTDLVAFLHGHARFNTGPTETTSVGGRRATAFDFAIDDAQTVSNPQCPGPCVPFTRLSDGAELGFLAGEEGRMFIVEGPSGPLVIVYSSPQSAAEEHKVSSERVLASLRFRS
jgi:hypothetical protein